MEDQSMAKGFAVLSFAGILVKVLSLLYIPVLRQPWMLGDKGYGIYGAAYTVFAFVFVLANSGISVAISKIVSELIAKKNYKDAIVSFKIARMLLLIAGIFLSILMFALASPIAAFINKRSMLAIAALSPSIIFTVVASAYRGFFQGRGNMFPTAVSQIIEQITNIIFTLGLAALFLKYGGLEWACAGGALGTGVAAMASVIFLIIYYRKNKNFKVSEPYSDINIERYSYKQLLKTILSYSFPITLCIGLQYAGSVVDASNTMWRLRASGFSLDTASTLYAYLLYYQQLLMAPIAISTALMSTILPAISEAVALKDHILTQKRMAFAYRLCFMFTIPAALALSVLSAPIFRLLSFGPRYDLMLYGSSALIFLTIVQIQTAILQGSGKLYRVVFNLVMGIVGKIIINYILIGIHGINIYGAIVGSISGYLISIVLNYFTIQKHLKVDQNLVKRTVKPIISAAVMSIAVFIVYKGILLLPLFKSKAYLFVALATATASVIGFFVYLFLMILIGGIKKNDMNILPARLVRFIPKALAGRVG